MATIECVTLGLNGKSFVKTEHANISDIVGIGGKNERNDVMVIQALFRLVGYIDRTAKEFFGLTVKDLPEPTGDFDEKTIRAIWAFQRKMSYRLLNIDGKIHPADYKNRILGNAFNKGSRLMAITLLNDAALDGEVALETANKEEAIRKLAPSIILSRIC
jgi:hypothetical protein